MEWGEPLVKHLPLLGVCGQALSALSVFLLPDSVGVFFLEIADQYQEKHLKKWREQPEDDELSNFDVGPSIYVGSGTVPSAKVGTSPAGVEFRVGFSGFY